MITIKIKQGYNDLKLTAIDIYEATYLIKEVYRFADKETSYEIKTEIPKQTNVDE